MNPRRVWGKLSFAQKSHHPRRAVVGISDSTTLEQDSTWSVPSKLADIGESGAL